MGRYGRVLTGVFGVRERASKCEEHPVILPRLQVKTIENRWTIVATKFKFVYNITSSL